MRAPHAPVICRIRRAARVRYRLEITTMFSLTPGGVVSSIHPRLSCPVSPGVLLRSRLSCPAPAKHRAAVSERWPPPAILTRYRLRVGSVGVHSALQPRSRARLDRGRRASLPACPAPCSPLSAASRPAPFRLVVVFVVYEKWRVRTAPAAIQS